MIKKIIMSVLVIVMGGLMVTAPVMADTGDSNCVETAILGDGGESCDDGSGSAIKDILRLVVEIMTVGVGILGVLGITIVGIQYLTAGGDEGKTRKAKQRILEIVIGLAFYAILFAFLSFLIPGFDPFGW